jgi:hypothetical protein
MGKRIDDLIHGFGLRFRGGGGGASRGGEGVKIRACF